MSIACVKHEVRAHYFPVPTLSVPVGTKGRSSVASLPQLMPWEPGVWQELLGTTCTLEWVLEGGTPAPARLGNNCTLRFTCLAISLQRPVGWPLPRFQDAGNSISPLWQH